MNTQFELHIKDIHQLALHYVPFFKNGGIALSSETDFALPQGQEVTLRYSDYNTPPLTLQTHVAFITFQAPFSIGLAFGTDEAARQLNQKMKNELQHILSDPSKMLAIPAFKP
ncbi:MAG: hypothetical protein Q4E16_02615 [Neisseria sp.]|nr:hypothetical protein [Neisseria sp.]